MTDQCFWLPLMWLLSCLFVTLFLSVQHTMYNVCVNISSCSKLSCLWRLCFLSVWGLSKILKYYCISWCFRHIAVRSGTRRSLTFISRVYSINLFKSGIKVQVKFKKFKSVWSLFKHQCLVPFPEISLRTRADPEQRLGRGQIGLKWTKLTGRFSGFWKLVRFCIPLVKGFI